MNGKKELPNIVFIVLDTVGAKRMSLYGFPRRTTPHLERIAEECTVYNRCFAPACWTIPSHASMFTGLYPSQHGTHEANLILNDNYQHLASVLKMAGYQNFGLISNGLVSPESGLCRDFDFLKVFGVGGFARFQAKFGRSQQKEDRLIPKIVGKVTIKDKMLVVLKHFLQTSNYRQAFEDLKMVVNNKANRFFNPTPFQKSSKYTIAIVKMFEEMVKKHKISHNGKPYFCFINFVEAHEMYRPPVKTRCFSRLYDKQYRRSNSLYKRPDENVVKVLKDLHDDEIYFLDLMMSKFWDNLKKLPDFDNTVVIITSDHGEHLGEKGYYGHALSLYNDLIWVPLMVKFPEGLAQTGVSNRLTSLNDLYSTILDLTNSPLPGPGSSLSLLSASEREMVLAQSVFPGLWRGGLNARREKDPSFHPAAIAAITNKNNKIIESSNGKLELYDLNEDTDEEHNLIETISSEAKQNLRNLVDFIKNDSGYNDAVSRIETQNLANHQSATMDF